MERISLVSKVDNLLEELRQYMEQQVLSESEVYILKAEIDKILYECLYYKNKLIS
jgi:hypothetical protein